MSNTVADRSNLRVVKHWKTGEDQLIFRSIDSSFSSDSYIALDYFPGELSGSVEKINKSTFARLKLLKKEELKSITDLFGEGAVDGILSRRDKILRHFEERKAGGEVIFFDN